MAKKNRNRKAKKGGGGGSGGVENRDDRGAAETTTTTSKTPSVDQEAEVEESLLVQTASAGKLAVAGDGGISSSDDDSSSDEEDDDLVLEGMVRRVQGVPSSSDDEDDYKAEDLSSEEEENDAAEPSKKRARTKPPDAKKGALTTKVDAGGGGGMNGNKKSNKGGKHSKRSPKKEKDSVGDDEPDIINVEFLFCDMNEKFFHGIKTHLHNQPIHASHSSQLADLLIANVSVGTVLSTEDSDEDDPNVFGFASVINVTTNQSSPCVQEMKRLCLKHCPPERQTELETVLSGSTRRPAGFFFHGRMVNVPLEITEVLHQQLVLDMDWAVKNAEGGEEERKSLDFGAFVRMAPCIGGGDGKAVLYKYFDDEVFASNAEFVYTFDVPQSFGTEEKELCSVIVMTKTGHRDAMKDLAKLVGGR